MSLINNYLANFNGEKIRIDDYYGYQTADHSYFIVPTTQQEVVHLEQGWCADYFIHKGYLRIAKPIQNQQEQLITVENGQNYIVLKAKKTQRNNEMGATQLAAFHQTGGLYPYTPNYISTYGLWHSLWGERLAVFEAYYEKQIEVRPVSRYLRLFIDTFPYLIGLTENAIQYVQETNKEHRFDKVDQGCITFQRYNNQMERDVIFSDQFVYDHPTRDLAEYIRPYLLNNEMDTKANDPVYLFLKEYEKRQPLSVFSWRLLFARLLCPIHIFDFIEEAIDVTDKEETFHGYRNLLEKQGNYEKQLKDFFFRVGIDPNYNQIPFLEW